MTAEFCILYSYGRVGSRMRCNAESRVNSTIFHTQTTTIKIGCGIHFCCAGIADYLSRGYSPRSICFQNFIQVSLGIFTCEDDVASLLDCDRCSIRILISVILI